MHMSGRLKKLGQGGETIVEVLIAGAVISFGLLNAYGFSRHNTAAITDAQEHSQAEKYVETQLEYVRINQGIHNPNVCYDSNGLETSSSSGCNIAMNGPGTYPVFNMKITQLGQGAYSIAATWDNIYGTGKANVTMLYRPVGP
jgi:hypothetical protein